MCGKVLEIRAFATFGLLSNGSVTVVSMSGNLGGLKGLNGLYTAPTPPSPAAGSENNSSTDS